MNIGQLGTGGEFVFECYDKYGNHKWSDVAKNIVVNEALDHVLNVLFKSAAPIATWYIGLKAVGIPVAADTLASHPSWAEVTVYVGNRPAWSPGVVGSQSVTSTITSDFYMTAGAAIVGAMLCSVATTNVGILFCVSNFVSGLTRNVALDDLVRITYTIQASSV
jgi:hypothetical protein